MNTRNQTTNQPAETNNGPDYYVLSPRSTGRKQKLERIGAVWTKDDGGLCLRLCGTQIVSGDLYLYPPKTDA